MSLEKQEIISRLDINPENKTVSCAKDVLIKENGNIISRQRHRASFVPGDIEKVKEYLGLQECPEIVYLESLWTKEVITKYQVMLAEQVQQ